MVIFQFTVSLPVSSPAFLVKTPAVLMLTRLAEGGPAVFLGVCFKVGQTPRDVFFLTGTKESSMGLWDMIIHKLMDNSMDNSIDLLMDNLIIIIQWIILY